jgi:hypothetical protein
MNFIEAAAVFDIVSLRHLRLTETCSTKCVRKGRKKHNRRIIMKNRYQLFLILMALMPALAACSASCDCPRPGPATTTIVTPPPHATVVEPAD